MIITKTPFRVSLVGGGSDLPPYCNHKIGAVVSFAIDRYMYLTVSRRGFCPPHYSSQLFSNRECR